MKRPTIADLAQAADVSISTVDRVLNGRDPVRRATAERVLAAAEQIGFYATGVIRQRLGTDRPSRSLAFILQQSSSAFYRNLGRALAEEARASPAIRGHARIEFLDDLTPGSVADRLLKLGKDADAVALVAADHPRVAHAIERLGAQGVPVFALISGLTGEGLAGYVGLDNWKVGRTAAWAIANFCKQPGKVAILVGSHRYRCQEMCEMSFRSYFREQAPAFHLLEPLTSLEDSRLAHESTLDLLKRNPDLVGLYVAGGGIEGVVQALRDEGADVFGKIVTVGHELTDETRSGLIDGVLKLILAHPLKLLASATVSAMARSVEENRREPPAPFHLAFDIWTPEST